MQEEVSSEEDVPEKKEMEDDQSRGQVGSAGVLLVLGIVFVLAGFGIIALASLTKMLAPILDFELTGFAVFGIGIGMIALAWHRLS